MSADHVKSIEKVEAELLLLLQRVDPKFKPHTVDAQMSLADLGLTSLQVMLLIFEAEDRFDLELSTLGRDVFPSIRSGAEVIVTLLAEGKDPV